MPYVVAVVPHDFLGKFEVMCERATEAEVRRIAESKSPYTDIVDDEVENDDEPHHYSAIIWEGTLEDSYKGTLGKPIAIYYRGVEWSSDSK